MACSSPTSVAYCDELRAQATRPFSPSGMLAPQKRRDLNPGLIRRSLLNRYRRRLRLVVLNRGLPAHRLRLCHWPKRWPESWHRPPPERPGHRIEQAGSCRVGQLLHRRMHGHRHRSLRFREQISLGGQLRERQRLRPRLRHWPGLLPLTFGSRRGRRIVLRRNLPQQRRCLDGVRHEGGGRASRGGVPVDDRLRRRCRSAANRYQLRPLVGGSLESMPVATTDTRMRPASV